MFKDYIVSRFEEYTAYHKALSGTAEGLGNLKTFIRFCCKQFPTEPDGITKQMIDQYLIAHKMSNNSQYVFIAELRGFTKYLKFLGDQVFIPDEEYILHLESYRPYLFTDEELRNLFDVIDDYSYKHPNKKSDPQLILPPLFRMIYCCGLRPQEARYLKADDVNLDTGDVFIQKSKKNRDRHIIMSDDLKILCRYYDQLAGTREYFFEVNNKQIKSAWITDRFKDCWKKAYPDSQVIPRPYDLRHAFATRNLMRWIDDRQNIYELLPYLSAYMGHAEIKSTLYYIHLLPERIRTSAGIDWNSFKDIYDDTLEDQL